MSNELSKVSGIIQLIEYSDKAVAVIGDTKPIKDKLKSLGGSYNPNLKIEGETVKGWIFSRKKSLKRLEDNLFFGSAEDKNTSDYIQAQEEAHQDNEAQRLGMK